MSIMTLSIQMHRQVSVVINIEYLSTRSLQLLRGTSAASCLAAVGGRREAALVALIFCSKKLCL